MPVLYANNSFFRLSLSYPEELGHSLELLLRDICTKEGLHEGQAIEIVSLAKKGLFSLGGVHEEIPDQLGQAELFDRLTKLLTQMALAAGQSSAQQSISIRAAALSRQGRTILLPGLGHPGKDSLLLFLLANGYGYLSASLALMGREEKERRWQYLALPPFFANSQNARLPAFAIPVKEIVYGEKNQYLILEEKVLAQDAQSSPPAMLLFAHHVPGAGPRLSPLAPARAASMLLANLHAQGRKGFQQAARLGRSATAMQLIYGDLNQLENLPLALDYLLKEGCTGKEMAELLDSFQPSWSFSPPAQAVASITDPPRKRPSPTPAGKKKKLTIGMATYDDYDGVYFTVQALRLYHPEVTRDTEILVVDNNPQGPAAEALKELETLVANYRYFPFDDYHSTAVRDQIFRQANADYVLCLDGHVLLMPKVLQRLLDYFEKHPKTKDLLQGPMLGENLRSLHTHFEPVWNKGMYGQWALDKRGEDPAGAPFAIPMQGLGLFACRKEAWVGFNPRFRGFGGEEGYLHEKFRQRGNQALCLPFLRWVHRFARPQGVPYPISWEDRIYNYLVGYQELGLEDQALQSHFNDHLGAAASQELIKAAKKELVSPFAFFDAIYCITLDTGSQRWQRMAKRLKALGIFERVRIFTAIATPENHHIGCALSHRAIIERAESQGLSNVLVFEDDALFLDQSLEILGRSLAELSQQDWQLYYLGGFRNQQEHPLAAGCRHLRAPSHLTCTHAIAYGQGVYQKILSELPATKKEMGQWLKTHLAIDQYLSSIEKRFLANPTLASQAELLPYEDKELRQRFVLGDEAWSINNPPS